MTSRTGDVEIRQVESIEELDQVKKAPAGAFERMLAEEEYSPPRRGQLMEGIVLAIVDSGLIVDVGAKRDAIVPAADLRRLQEAVLDELGVGDAVPVCVLEPVNKNDDLIVSLSKGLEQQDWIEAKRVMDAGEIFEGRVVGHNKGGLLAQFGRLRAFVPNSLIAHRQRGLSREALVQAKPQMIGEELHLKVIEVDRNRGRLVASETAAQRARRAQVLRELTVGEVRTGAVTGLCDFGAFVDLGGIDGLVHISELAWHHVEHPSEVVQVGEMADVEVLAVDIARKRVRLSRKRALPDPWEVVDDKIHVGQVLSGRVKDVVGFGIFVELREGVEGLIEATADELSDPDRREPVEPGQKVTVRVLSVNAAARRIRLALVPDQPTEAPPDERIEAPPEAEATQEA